MMDINVWLRREKVLEDGVFVKKSRAAFSSLMGVGIVLLLEGRLSLYLLLLFFPA